MNIKLFPKLTGESFFCIVEKFFLIYGKLSIFLFDIF
jgi:hypothetical protein